MQTMKTRHILISAITFLTALSCVEGLSDSDVQTEGNMLKVKFDAPELIVKSGDETPIFYAYIPSELEAGYVHPIGYSDVTSDGYYLYNLPEGTTDVVFTNISSDNEEVTFKTDEEGRVVFELLDEHPMFDTDLLYGKVSGVDASSSFNVGIRRLNTRLSHYFHLIDSDGNSLATDEISRIQVSYDLLGKSVAIAEDGQTATIKHENAHSFSMTSGVGETDGHVFTTNVIPTGEFPKMKVTVEFTNGNKKEYEKTLDKIFEANRHYTVNLRMRKLNGEATFTLEDPEVYTTEQHPTFTAQEFFTLTGGTTVGSLANDRLAIDVDTALPYEWTYEVTQGGEYFNIEAVDGQLVITALSDNSNEIRSATIVLSTAEGYTKTFTVNQKNSLKHRIVMTSQHDYSYTEVYITGENITVQDPNDPEPVLYEGTSDNKCIDIDGLTIGSQIIIEGDVITGFRATGRENGSYTDRYGYSFDNYSETRGYYYSSYSRNYHSFSFENCIYMEDLVLQGSDATVDVSGMPLLKRLHIQENSSLTSVIFAAGQPIRHLTIYNCDALTGIDVSNISSTVRSINLYDSDALTGAILVNCTALDHINVNYCNNMGVVNLTGCSSLEDIYIYNNSATYLNFTNCSELKTLRLESLELNRLVTTGADKLESIETEDISIKSVDLSNKSMLSSIGRLTSVETFDISNSPNVKEIDLSLNSGATQTLNFSGTGIESATIDYLNHNLDFSSLTAVRKMNLRYCQSAVTGFDLSTCTTLEELYISFNSSNYTTMQTLGLPASLKKLNLRHLYYYPGPLDLSDFTELVELDLYHLSEIREINLSGCSALKSVNKDDSDNDDDNNSDPYCYNVQAVNMTGCSSLEYFNMFDANITSLDFTSNPAMYHVDVRYNNMEATAIDNMILSLPDRSMSATQGKYMIDGNPGANSHNETAANDKGWWL